jgi:hypothetical protein
MNQINYFLQPQNPRQRQYEALKAFYCDKLSTNEIVEKFGLSKLYFNKLKHQFSQYLENGVNPFFEQKRRDLNSVEQIKH